MRKKIAWRTLALALLAAVSSAATGQSRTSINDHTITFRVLVVDAPCSIRDSDRDLLVDMGETSLRDLQTNPHGAWQDFSIGLTNCNTDTFHAVSVTFLGTEETELPGRLAIDGSSSAKGIAIGIYHANALLNINTASGGFALQKGDNTIPFAARIEKVRDNLLQPGAYTATAHFKLSYL